jgi:hypothetical protein
MEAALNSVVQVVLGGNGNSASATARAEIGWGSVRLLIISRVLLYWGRVSSLGPQFPVHSLLRARMKQCLHDGARCQLCQRFIDAAIEIWGHGSQHRLLMDVKPTQPERNTARLQWKTNVTQAVQAAVHAEFIEGCQSTSAGQRYLEFKHTGLCARYLQVARRLRCWRAHPALELLIGLRTGDHELRDARRQRGAANNDGLCECGNAETAAHFLLGCPLATHLVSHLLDKLHQLTYVNLTPLNTWGQYVQIMRWLDGIGISDSALEGVLVSTLEHVHASSNLRRQRKATAQAPMAPFGHR